MCITVFMICWLLPLLCNGFHSVGLPARSRQLHTHRNLLETEETGKEESRVLGTYKETPGALKLVIEGLTDGLNAGVSAFLGSEESKEPDYSAVTARTAGALLKRIQEDYKERAYFLTGNITGGIYSKDCRFIDPTIAFEGLDVWRRNIRSLKTLTAERQIDLKEIRLDDTNKVIEAEWELSCLLLLPWRPRVRVAGSTLHTFEKRSEDGTLRVVRHEERWKVSGWEAFLQLFGIGGGEPEEEKRETEEKRKLERSMMNRLGGALGSVAAGAFLGISAGGGLTSLETASIATGMNSAQPAHVRMATRSFLGPRAAEASSQRVVAEIGASGFIFKDKIRVEAFQDEKVPGVTIFLSDFDRPITEKLSKDFFSDPTSNSIACTARNGVVSKLDKKISRSPEGEEVISENRSLFFKSIKVRRVVDEEGGNIVYVSFSTRFDRSDDSNKGRFKSSLCAVPYMPDGRAPESSASP
mmetsp:Transcript_24020/g.47163  ORF Transcript_24020/g.47163 Transcript_24020/m.47163 type:complete len:470 (-) Transcript_24020:111-1520(-)